MFSNSRIQHVLALSVMFFLFGVSGCYNIPPPSCEANSLIEFINHANTTPATTDTMDLQANCTYVLTEINNNTWGSSGLPVITSPIIINGNGSSIERDQSAAKFRLFYINGFGGDLTLTELALTGGYSYDPASPNNVFTNSGGAILNQGQLTVAKTSINNNSGREGGGIFNTNHMILKDVTIDSNQDYFGLPGGAGIHNKGIGVIMNTTISHNGFNQAQPADGIFNAQSGNLEMTNSTVSGNAGCGIDNEGNLRLNHVTIAFNTCAIGSAGDLYTSNSIFADTGCSNNIHTTYTNFDIDGTCGGIPVSISALQLEPLANNGGVTRTHALRAGSVAIDKVIRSCLPKDQRHIARPFGPKCDVGAYEYTGPMAPTETRTPSPTPSPTSSPTPTSTFTPTPQPQACIFTATINLFCRSGPGASLYPGVDEFIAGESAPVVGQSSDGTFVYVEGLNTGRVCTVPSAARFGTLNGDCVQLPFFTPPAPLLVPQEPEEESSPQPQLGCTVQLATTGALICQMPCPAGATPGDPCSP